MNPSSDDFEWVNAWAAHARAASPAARPKAAAEAAVAPSPVQMAEAGARFAAQDIVAPKAPAAADAAPKSVAPSQPSPKVAADPERLVHPATQRFFAALLAQAADAPEMPPAAAPVRVAAEGSFVPATFVSAAPAAAQAIATATLVDPPSADPVLAPATEPPVALAPQLDSALVSAVDQPPAPSPAVIPHAATTQTATAPAETVATPALAVPAPVRAVSAPVAPVFVVPDRIDAVPPAAPAAIVSVAPTVLENPGPPLAPEIDRLERDIADIERARDALSAPEPFTLIDPRKLRTGPFAAIRNAESVPILIGSVVGATLLIVFGAAASLISLR